MLTTLMALVVSAPVTSEWPHWMGPTRDNVWHDAGILEKFPAGGPKVLWKAPVEVGYSGPAVAGGYVYLQDYITKAVDDGNGNFNRKPTEGTERVLAFDLNGKQLWKYEVPVKYEISYPNGPRCTPVVHDGKVYTLGAMGHLACLNTKTGEKIWAKDLVKEYGAKPALWGYAAHPVIEDGILYTLGGIDNNHIVALDPATGKEIWKNGTQNEQGYCPVLFTTTGGVKQLIASGPKFIRGMDPKTGKIYWEQPYDATSGSVIMTPVIDGDNLFVGGYRGKNLMLKLGASEGKPTAEKVWRDEKKLGISPVNVQPFQDGNVMYGYNEDGTMYAVEIPSGKRLWEDAGPVGKVLGSGTAFIVKNGDRYFFFTEMGDLVIGKLSREKYEEIDRAKLLEATGRAFGRRVVWSMPAFADKKMYVRNDKEMICVDLAK